MSDFPHRRFISCVPYISLRSVFCPSSPFLHAAVCLVWLYRFLQHHVQNCLRVRCGVHKSKSIIQYVDYFIERLGEALSLHIGGLNECSQGRYVWITRKARMASEILVFTAATPKKTAIESFLLNRIGQSKTKRSAQLTPSLWVLP